MIEIIVYDNYVEVEGWVFMRLFFIPRKAWVRFWYFMDDVVWYFRPVQVPYQRTGRWIWDNDVMGLGGPADGRHVSDSERGRICEESKDPTRENRTDAD